MKPKLDVDAIDGFTDGWNLLVVANLALLAGNAHRLSEQDQQAISWTIDKALSAMRRGAEQIVGADPEVRP